MTRMTGNFTAQPKTRSDCICFRKAKSRRSSKLRAKKLKRPFKSKKSYATSLKAPAKRINSTFSARKTPMGINGPNAGGAFAGKVLPGGNGKGIAGHGELRPGAGATTVPPGTRLVAPRHGIKISDTAGRVLEDINLENFANADPIQRDGLISRKLNEMGVANKISRDRAKQDLQGVRVLNPGEAIQNYTVKEPGIDMSIHQASTTVPGATQLSSILKPGAGTVSLATCTEVRGM